MVRGQATVARLTMFLIFNEFRAQEAILTGCGLPHRLLPASQNKASLKGGGQIINNIVSTSKVN